MLHSLVSEFLGTFIFVSVILYIVTIYPNNIFVPLVIGLALAVGIWFALMGSKGSLNPAVTLALFANGTLNGSQALVYMLAEFSGAVLAFVIWKWMVLPKCAKSP